MLYPNLDILQDIMHAPYRIVEYKECIQHNLLKESSIITFPLQPKPHNATSSWIADHWY